MKKVASEEAASTGRANPIASWARLPIAATLEVFCFHVFPVDPVFDNRSVFENHGREKAVAEIDHGVKHAQANGIHAIHSISLLVCDVRNFGWTFIVDSHAKQKIVNQGLPNVGDPLSYGIHIAHLAEHMIPQNAREFHVSTKRLKKTLDLFLYVMGLSKTHK